jgi:hypothetical protein
MDAIKGSKPHGNKRLMRTWALSWIYSASFRPSRSSLLSLNAERLREDSVPVPGNWAH